MGDIKCMLERSCVGLGLAELCWAWLGWAGLGLAEPGWDGLSLAGPDG